MIFKTLKNKKGFTLLEMIVALAIFSMVALVAVGALIKIIDANKKAQSLKTAINNVSFALESMSRELRTGTNYVCYPKQLGAPSVKVDYSTNTKLPFKNSCTAESVTNNWVLGFYSSDTAVDPVTGNTCKLVVIYRNVSGTIEKAKQENCSDILDSNLPDHFYPVVSPDIVFERSSVNVEVDVLQNTQSFVFIHLVGYVGGKPKTQTYFDVQTSVSQRLSD